MTKIIAIAVAVVLAVGAVCYFSPTAKYAVKGRIAKIENAAQLGNAIEILEAKNSEMQEKFFGITVAINRAKSQSAAMQRRAGTALDKYAKTQNQFDLGKYGIYTNGVARIDRARAKLETVRDQMKRNLVDHRAKIELLKAQLAYLDSLKTLNSYLKDANVSPEFCNGVNNIVEEAIQVEESMNSALCEMGVLNAELTEMK